ncbi:hypothetical protein NP493_1081g02029 [Ridgeia piscesae]|uniref:Uncharacterized protein n=1 Tax=Ridgeia piscesae TaxID=27915 RepID=A0AAD9NJX5_RIDPI|nr:hypothetical protein NP493_1081g02029 [Ridgeia piscesae]
MIIRQPSICCIVGSLNLFITVFNLTLLYFSRQFVPVTYAGIKTEVCPEPFTLGMTHAKLWLLKCIYGVPFRHLFLNILVPLDL